MTGQTLEHRSNEQRDQDRPCKRWNNYVRSEQAWLSVPWSEATWLEPRVRTAYDLTHAKRTQRQGVWHTAAEKMLDQTYRARKSVKWATGIRALGNSPLYLTQHFPQPPTPTWTSPERERVNTGDVLARPSCTLFTLKRWRQLLHLRQNRVQ